MYSSIPYILNYSKYFPFCFMEEESHTGLNSTRLSKWWQICHFVVNYLFIDCAYSLSIQYMQEARQQCFSCSVWMKIWNKLSSVELWRLEWRGCVKQPALPPVLCALAVLWNSLWRPWNRFCENDSSCIDVLATPNALHPVCTISPF